MDYLWALIINCWWLGLRMGIINMEGAIYNMKLIGATRIRIVCKRDVPKEGRQSRDVKSYMPNTFGEFD